MTINEAESIKSGTKVKANRDITPDITKGVVYEVGGIFHDKVPGYVGIKEDDKGKPNGVYCHAVDIISDIEAKYGIKESSVSVNLTEKHRQIFDKYLKV